MAQKHANPADPDPQHWLQRYRAQGYLSGRDGVRFARRVMQAGQAGQAGGQGRRPQEGHQALQAQPAQPGEPLGRGGGGGGPRASGGTRRLLRFGPVAEGDKRLGKKID
jgi:hypothetical protein